MTTAGSMSAITLVRAIIRAGTHWRCQLELFDRGHLLMTVAPCQVDTKVSRALVADAQQSGFIVLEMSPLMSTTKRDR